MGRGKKVRSWFKSAISGRFVTKAWAKRSPDTTYKQTKRRRGKK